MNDYKKGDRLQVKPLPWLLKHSEDWTSAMFIALQGTDNTVIFDNKVGDENGMVTFRIHFPCNSSFNRIISENDILGPAFEWNEEINVRDNKEEPWFISRFSNYMLCRDGQILTCGVDDTWNMSRKIQPAPTPTIDGVIADLRKILSLFRLTDHANRAQNSNVTSVEEWESVRILKKAITKAEKLRKFQNEA